VNFAVFGWQAVECTERKPQPMTALMRQGAVFVDRGIVAMEPVIIHARDGLELVCYLPRPPTFERTDDLTWSEVASYMRSVFAD
jgi:hypothetical protein